MPGLITRHHTERRCRYCKQASHRGRDAERRNSCATCHPTKPVLCTRPLGHDDDHVACGVTDHAIVVWPQTIAPAAF